MEFEELKDAEEKAEARGGLGGAWSRATRVVPMPTRLGVSTECR